MASSEAVIDNAYAEAPVRWQAQSVDRHPDSVIDIRIARFKGREMLGEVSRVEENGEKKRPTARTRAKSSAVPVPRPVVTIHDVASLAGVSSMTVSRVMNGKRHVSQEVRDRVNAAVTKLNFSPNLTARSFSSAVRIGAIYSNPSSSNLGSFLMGAFRQSGESGCQFLIEPGSTETEAIASLKRLIEQRIGGIILPPPLCDSEAVLELATSNGVIPLAFATAIPREGVSAIIVDDYKGAFDMTRYLISLGHRSIGFVQGNPKHSPSQRREQGYRAAMAGASLMIDDEWIAPGLFTYKSGLEAAQRLLGSRQRPTAIFASNDDMAAAIVAVAHGMGLKIPEDISIAGFDDSQIASTIWPELTTIRQPISDMASRAVALLNEQFRESRAGRAQEVRHVREMLTLVERASTGPV